MTAEPLPTIAPLQRRIAAGLVASACLLAALLGLYHVRTFDTFFHLAAGRFIIAQGRVPSTDPFSFTFRGTPWSDHSWGFQAFLAALHGVLGFVGVSCWQALLALATALVPCLALRRMPLLWPWAALLCVLPHAAYREVLEARPHMAAYLCLALTLYICLHWAADNTARRLLWLVPLYALWTSVHGSHVVLLVVCAICAGAAWGERRLVYARICTLVILACIALGLGLAPDAFQLNGAHVSSSFLEGNVREWTPIAALDLVTFWPGRAFALCAFLAFVGLVVRADDPPGLAGLPRGWAPAILLCAFTAFALTSRRMLALYGLAASPLWLPYAARALERIVLALSIARAQTMAFVVAAGGLLVFGAGSFAYSPDFKFGAGLMTERLPIAAVVALRKIERIHRVYNAYNFGGYLMFEGYPRDGVFVDGRAITVYPPSFLDEFERAYDDPGTFERLAARFSVDAVLMPSSSTRTRRLLAYLSRSPVWHLLHEDPVATAYVRIGGK